MRVFVCVCVGGGGAAGVQMSVFVCVCVCVRARARALTRICVCWRTHEASYMLLSRDTEKPLNKTTVKQFLTCRWSLGPDDVEAQRRK